MPIRRNVAALAVAAAVLGAGGCGHFAANMRMRELVVQFKPGTPQPVRASVLHGCRGFPDASPEPMPSSTLPSVQLNNVRFRVDNADDAQIAAVEDCLARFTAVIGVHDTGQDMH